MKILVTAGGTKEYIDGVRYIGNSSSGKTGADLSDYLSQLGHEVLWLGATAAVKPKGPAKQLQYETFDELASGLKSYLASQHVDLVFQAAAVSDFKVSAVELDGKVFKTCRDVKLPTADEVKLVLVKQPKLVSSLKSWSKNANLKVVAFKLTNSPESQVRTEAVAKLIQQSGIDWVAHNDLQEITAEKHAFQLFRALDEHMTCQDICQLADAVIEQVGELL